MPMNTGTGSFPTTDWGLFVDIRGNNSVARMAAMDILIRRYWKPVYMFLRKSGMDESSAKDVTQSFFGEWIEKDVFAKADKQKGRFRSFVLSCLKRYVSNIRRADQAKKRMPTDGFVSLDELMDHSEMPFEPSDNMTPDMVFDRAWAAELVLRVLRHLEKECNTSGKDVHYNIFSRRIICPILEGATEPLLADLAKEHGIEEKQVANLLLTAKRAYQRLLKQEIRLYAETEAEVTSEVMDIFCILNGR